MLPSVSPRSLWSALNLLCEWILMTYHVRICGGYPGMPTPSGGVFAMADFIYLVIGATFLGGAILYAYGCERL